MAKRGFILLIYKLPQQPTRLRIQAWRRLQAVGALYLQDGVAVLPNRPDLNENLRYIAASIVESGGTAISLLSSGSTHLDEAEIENRFRIAADGRMLELTRNLKQLAESLAEVRSLHELAKVDDALKRERLAYLKARRLNYFGSEVENEVELVLKELATRLKSYGGTLK